MKWIGQHIWDFISRFRSDVYLEATDSGTIASGGNLGLDSNNKVVKATGVSSSTLASTVTVTDSTANTNFPIVFHDESNGLLDDTGALQYNPSLASLTLKGSGNGSFNLMAIADSNNDVHLNFFNTKDGGAGADNDNLGTLTFYGKNDAGTPQTLVYGSLTTYIGDASDDDEAGVMTLKVATEGTERQVLTGTGDGASSKVDVGLGYGTASVTTIAGTLTMGSTAAMTNAGLLSVAAQTNITSLGTLTNLDVDNININGDTITGSGDLTIAATGNDILVDTDNIVIDSTTSGKPVLELSNRTEDSSAPTLKFTNTNGGTDGDLGDYAGTIQFTGNDDGTPSEQIYGQIHVRQHVAVSDEESGDLTMLVAAHDGDLNSAFRALGGSVDSEVDVTIANGASSLTTVAGDLKVTGTPFVGFHGSHTRIKILPSDFQADDVGRPVMTEDDVADERFLFSHSSAKMYASIPIPTGYKATHVKIHGSDTGQTHTTYEANIANKDVVEKGSATAIETEKAITNVTSSSTNYLLIEVSSDGASDEIHGGYVTIALV